MRRPRFASVAVLATAAALAACPGCGRGDRDGSSSKSPTKTVAPTITTPTGGPPPFEGWGQPDGVLVLTGQMVGYLEPCGCSEDQKGGLGRRYDLIEQLRKRGWPVVPVDLGQLLNDPNARGGLEQTRIKNDIALKALNAMKYEAFALAPSDLRVGAFEALGQYSQYDAPKAVAANVRPIAALESAVVPSVRAKAGTISLGITAAVDADALNKMADPAIKELLEIRKADDALPEVLADLEKDTDLQILLVQGEPEEAERLARQFPGFDVVMATSHYPEPPDHDPKVVNDGKTWILTVGKKGMHVGVLGIYKDGDPRFRYEDVTLTKQGFTMADPMKQLIDEDFQALLRDESVVENYPRREHPSGGEFVGARACRQCHPLTYAKWEGTKHAHAFESLLPRKRAFDAECIACHATGLEYASGYRSAESTPNLKGNQCENCHGPGSKHVQNPRDPAALAPMKITREWAQQNLCTRCHDEDNSPKFNFDTYWGQIVHKGLDKH